MKHPNELHFFKQGDTIYAISEQVRQDLIDRLDGISTAHLDEYLEGVKITIRGGETLRVGTLKKEFYNTAFSSYHEDSGTYQNHLDIIPQKESYHELPWAI